MRHGALLVKIPVRGDSTDHYYAVELRQKSGWDQNIPHHGVLIHEWVHGLSHWTDRRRASWSGTSCGMIVVTNRIPVAKGYEIDFEDRFKRRVHLVDRHPGFVRNEVHRPRAMKFDHESGTWKDDPEAQGYYEVKTWWRTFDDFVSWTQSPAFAEAHSSRPPKEMFAGANVLEVHEVLTSTDLNLG